MRKWGLKRLTLLGSGKSADLELSLTDDSRFRMGAGDLRVTACPGTTIRTSSRDDVSLKKSSPARTW
ncbi:hypothetical protein GCM10009780_34370 [Actinomadura alba]